MYNEVEIKFVDEYQFLYDSYILRGFKVKEYEFVAFEINRYGRTIPCYVNVKLENKKRKKSVKLLLKIDTNIFN